jgi:hypothetical protein
VGVQRLRRVQIRIVYLPTKKTQSIISQREK